MTNEMFYSPWVDGQENDVPNILKLAISQLLQIQEKSPHMNNSVALAHLKQALKLVESSNA